MYLSVSSENIRFLLTKAFVDFVFAETSANFLTVACDRKLRILTTNKFIASLAISDLLIGIVVMPLSLYAKLRSDTWVLGEQWCTFHLMSAIFSTTASIVHLVAISLDRYFAIMFPTEYQRHSISTSALPYVIMIWTMSLAVSSTLFLSKPLDSHGICWVEDPQYLVLSSFLSFFLPGAIVVYLYVKIFQKLRKHKLFMFGTTGLLGKRKSGGKTGDKNRTLPEVIIEEVKSRRGSRLSQVSESRKNSGAGTLTKPERSPSQPEMHQIPVVQQRWRSPTICAETLEHDRKMASKKCVNIVDDPPSMEITITDSPVALSDFNSSTNGNKMLHNNSHYFATMITIVVFSGSAVTDSVVITTDPQITFRKKIILAHLLFQYFIILFYGFCRRVSMNSFNSSLTESDSAGDVDSRRSSTWSAARATILVGQLGCAIQGALPGKLKRIATQVTRAVRQKRRESMAMRRESRATRVVAAILIAFLICWIPYFCVSVYRGICTGLQIPFDKRFHAQLFVATSWLGYTHSCFNPIIYTSLNKNFRRRFRELLCLRSKDLMCF
uniref:G_PROTEIN_RECEP_F1_2 domain-containing protein n=1 Tax=Syphacia muris TaxID=451379 RepID=A0A0N5AK73_9BILA